MGEGANKIAKSLIDIQPTAIVEFFLLYFNSVDQPDSYIAFHGGSIYNDGITWQGIEYLPIPVETEGFEITANGQLPRPKIKVSNKDFFVTDLLIKYNDLQFAKIVRKRTFVKYLDDKNFDGGNPWGEADATAEISNDTYVISQKTAENKVFVEFELSSPLDLENFELNNRMIMSRYCFWQYRGLGCRYDGPPIETEDEKPLGLHGDYLNWGGQDTVSSSSWSINQHYTVGSAVFIENKKIILNSLDGRNQEYAKIWYVCQKDHTSSNENHPEQNNSFWLKDGCSKKLHSCRKRFQNSPTQSILSSEQAFSFYEVDFSKKIKNPSNNVAYEAITTADSFYPDTPPNFASDGLFGDTYSWVSMYSTGWVKFSWNEIKSGIFKINLFDRPTTYFNINNAKISFSDSSVLNGISIPADGSIKEVNIAPPKNSNYVLVSGYGSTQNTTLSEVEILTSGVGLYNTTFKTDNIYKKEQFAIALWGEFPSGIPTAGKYNLFHNIKDVSGFSGINVYLDCDRQKVVCNYSIIEVYPPVYNVQYGSEVLKNETIEGSYANIFAKNKFCILFKNRQSLIGPTGSEWNQIAAYDINGRQIFEKTLRGEDKTTYFSGQVFSFRDSRYENRLSDNLWFAVNNWENNRGLEKISPMKLGTVAIWTGEINPVGPIYKWFTRYSDEFYVDRFQRTYEEIQHDPFGENIKSSLYCWWDMEFTGSNPTYIKNSHGPTANLNFSGVYLSEYNSINSKITPVIYEVIQTPKTYLPFGGFPGTDKYG